jgi:hypothetical protein
MFLIGSIKHSFSDDNTNCPVNQIVATVSECKLAASELGIKYIGNVNKTNRPAGCYSLRNREKVYFNSVVDPKSTSSLWGEGAGICLPGIITLATYKYLSYSI